MRLDKLLAHMGYGSRKEVKQLISDGQVRINQELMRKVGYNVNLDEDQVFVGEAEVHYQEFYYLMLNKPQGVISATEDGRHPTVIDCIDSKYRHLDLFPVGRLDIDTTGFILLTNNGKLAHYMLSPRQRIPKVYQARVAGIVTEDDIQAFQRGLDLGDFTSLPAKLEILASHSASQESETEVTIVEGKFHQVKRMFAKRDKQVLKLHRIAIGPLTLDEDLGVGEYRLLSPEEISLLERNFQA